MKMPDRDTRDVLFMLTVVTIIVFVSTIFAVCLIIESNRDCVFHALDAGQGLDGAERICR